MEQPADSIGQFSLVRQHRRMLAQMNYYALTSESVSPTDFTLDQAWYRIPFEDNSFDFIFSEAIAETVRKTEKG